MIIKVCRNPYDEEKPLYKTATLNLEKGITCLVGRNGTGKTTLLQQIESHCRKNKIKCIQYDNYHDGGQNALSKYGYFGDFNSLATSFMSSEGQRIIYNFGQNLLGNLKANLKEHKQVVLLIDAIDSGLDLANIEEIKYILSLIIEDHSDKEIYIVITANTYALCEGLRCVNAKDFKEIVFNDYLQYKKFITRGVKYER